MHTRGRVIFIWASWLWVETACWSPAEWQDTKQAQDPVSASNPREGDMSWCYPCSPEASRHVCIMSMRPGLGSSVAKLNNLSRNMWIIWDKSRILRCNRTNDYPLLCDALDVFAYPPRNCIILYSTLMDYCQPPLIASAELFMTSLTPHLDTVHIPCKYREQSWTHQLECAALFIDYGLSGHDEHNNNNNIF